MITDSTRPLVTHRLRSPRAAALAGITLWLAALNPAPLHTVERSPLGTTLGHERMYFNLEQAVEAYMQRTDQ